MKNLCLALLLAATSVQARPVAILDQSTHVHAAHDFAFRWMGEAIAEKDSEGKNLVLSPVSAHYAFSLLFGGADGHTRDEMVSSFGLPLYMENWSLHQFNKEYAEMLQGLEGVELKLANNIWAHNTYDLEKSFIRFAKDNYDAPVSTMDFRRNADAAASHMNKWAADNTNDRIKEIMDADTVRDLDFLLANATYFKGTWLREFDQKRTKDRRFTLSTGEQIEAPAMLRNEAMVYGEKIGHYQAVSIPFKGNEAEMVVILPELPVREFAKTALTPEFFEGLEANMWERENVTLQLPKFEVKSSKELNEVMKSERVGLAGIFGEPTVPNFSKMSPMGAVVTMVKQDAFMKVDEKGAEAAAVTVIGGVRTTSAPVARDPVMIVDRPFMVLIREKKMNSILFLGMIENPTLK